VAKRVAKDNGKSWAPSTLGYIDCELNGVPIQNAMLDSGAGLEVISEKGARRVGAVLLPLPKSHCVRLADGTATEVRHHCVTKLVIRNIGMMVDLSVIGMDSDFDLLIGRQALRRLQAVEDYAREVLMVKGRIGTSSIVPIHGRKPETWPGLQDLPVVVEDVASTPDSEAEDEDDCDDLIRKVTEELTANADRLAGNGIPRG
jgi:hypothetical protein